MSLRPLQSPTSRLVRNLDSENLAYYNQMLAAANAIKDPATREEWFDALQTFARTLDFTVVEDVRKYKRKIVDIEEFLFGKQYLHLDRDSVYPSVHQACIDLDSDSFSEAVLEGAMGTGKSTVGNMMLARQLYKLSCMVSPQLTFGVQAHSSLVFTIQSVRFGTAKKAVFEEFGQYIGNSPYFNTMYQYDHKIQSQMIFRSNNVSVLPVTSANTGVISMNVIGGILDEMNFMQKISHSKSGNADDSGEFDQARQLYNIISRRRKTRFTRQGKLPGILFLISSSRFPDDFTARKGREAAMCGGTDPSIYVYSHSQWSAKKRDTFLKETFRVMVGNHNVRSKVIAPSDPEPFIPDGCRVIDVPMDFYQEFMKDVDGSIRDIAGITTITTHPFIIRRDMIYEAMEQSEQAGYFNIFDVESADFSIGLPAPITDRIRLDVDAPRVCHIDLGLKKDACGIAIGHVAGVRTITRSERDREKMSEGKPLLAPDMFAPSDIMPIVAIDFAMRITPPPNDEIDFSNIRKFLIRLRDHYNIPIKYVTMDGFQSVDSRQILKKRGFMTDYLSVEKIEPYRSLRDALYERRLLLPKNLLASAELAELQYTVKNNKEKVDHRPNGRKDIADAICGVNAFLMRMRNTWAGYVVDNKEGMDLFGDKEYVSRLIEKELENNKDIDLGDYQVNFSRRAAGVRRSISRRNFDRK